MGKKNKYKQGNSPTPSNRMTDKLSSAATPVPTPAGATPPQPPHPTTPAPEAAPALQPLQPEQMSLAAYGHIQECLKDKQVEFLKKEDVTAVVQLAQHLRVFGLLSAVGYVRHAREGKIRERIRPMWTPLLWRLVCGDEVRPKQEKAARQALMNVTYTLSTEDPKGYMVKWRQGMKLANHWNFWARACQEETDEQPPEKQGTEDGNSAG
ncbi:hypothetical protein [Egbenema bharatensis]|uniref:hypothetical protein n=1 Tax=Egbenema bharatensis TaxID=3463334 RepID=UPI003A878B75